MLTAVQLSVLKPRATIYRVADAAGLCIEVRPDGGRSWRYRYRFAGNARMLSLGAYPQISLADARKRRDEARNVLQSGRDPSSERKADKLRVKLSVGNTFGAIALEWLEQQRGKLANITYRKSEWLFSFVLPALGARPIADITAPEILAILRGIEARGAHETAHRVKQRIGQVFRYAIATGRAERDPSNDLRGALAPVVTSPRSAVTDPKEVSELLCAIDGYEGQPVTMAALKLAPLVFARPGNLRAMEWSELDLDSREWRIPAHKMKVREAHVIPLAKQAVSILRGLQSLTGNGSYVFPSLRTGRRPMSENTINAALRRLGYDKDTMTGHGFRALASTRLNELGWAPDVIERQLAHAERNKVRAAYNRASYMAERRKMMQAWADYLDSLRVRGNVVKLARGTPHARGSSSTPRAQSAPARRAHR
ncbi:MAG: tyrosine-type recombinase/integrase [Xanthomonadaceae bacterium]|nr:tyrosine-type recombinase/integrase [Xanthomonadaceae bacterium]